MGLMTYTWDPKRKKSFLNNEKIEPVETEFEKTDEFIEQPTEPIEPEPTEKPIDAMTLQELKALAATNNIILPPTINKRTEIVEYLKSEGGM